MTATETARRTFYARQAVHVAIAGADTTLCGTRLIGAIDTEADANCPACAQHSFEMFPENWNRVTPIGDGESFTGITD